MFEAEVMDERVVAVVVVILYEFQTYSIIIGILFLRTYSDGCRRTIIGAELLCLYPLL